MKHTLTTAAIAAFALATPALAHEHKHAKLVKPAMTGMAGMDHSMMMNDPSNPYAKSEMDMHMKMMMAKAGDASEKWTRKMIEHHRGAIAMSRVALAQATDADTKRMAQMTIEMQEKDIGELQGWLSSHGKPVQ
ncbi:DUF305 domain-containing protein [Sphingomonas sp. HMP6]|uniref:DUF305 domain-containing protein n=1 Tax=Sphingomonas sp. HMP6 TaxID=1517551 RepID=UPI0015971152|nr:DUF305 domain-containing protein [Sphingomonas sp. HMP6]BCA59840.1 hypothetical protein HMP06_2609 [Sphingomonas sp. HMP6]